MQHAIDIVEDEEFVRNLLSLWERKGPTRSVGR
jgi:hypothetical protein